MIIPARITYLRLSLKPCLRRDEREQIVVVLLKTAKFLFDRSDFTSQIRYLLKNNPDSSLRGCLLFLERPQILSDELGAFIVLLLQRHVQRCFPLAVAHLGFLQQ